MSDLLYKFGFQVISVLQFSPQMDVASGSDKLQHRISLYLLNLDSAVEHRFSAVSQASGQGATCS